MLIFKRFLIMVQFMTTIPIRKNFEFDNKDLGKGLALAPLVGVVIGGILALSFKGMECVFPRVITAAFLITAYIILTGGLHFDGLGDTFDGVFSNRSREKMLEIMHDSRIGTNAALAIACVIMIDVVFLMNLDSGILVGTLAVMPVAGRLGSLVGAGAFKYARRDESLGKPFIDYCGVKEIITGLLIYFAAFFAVFANFNLSYLLISPLPVVFALLLAKYFAGKIGGVTGDVLGAVCELNQMFFLISIYIAQKYFF